MDLYDIIIELISMFEDICLIRLLIINKKMNESITKYFTNKLMGRHLQCVDMGDTIDIGAFCNHFIRRIHYGSHMYLKYDYCDDCSLFSLQTNQKIYESGLPTSRRICELGCDITCCGKNNKIPKSYDTDIKLLCGCYVTTRCVSTKLKCKCGNMITNRITKCAKCDKIPLRLFAPDLSSTSSDDDCGLGKDYENKYLKYKSKCALSEFSSTSSDEDFY